MATIALIGPQRPLKIIRGKFASAAIYSPAFDHYRTSLKMSPCKTYQITWMGDTSVVPTPCTFLGLQGGAVDVLTKVREYLAYNDRACEQVLAEIEQIEARLLANPVVKRLRARRATH